MPVPLPFGPPDGSGRSRQAYYGDDISGAGFLTPSPFAGVSDDFNSALSAYGTAATQAQALGQPVERSGGLLTGVSDTLDKFVSTGSGFFTGLFGADLILDDGTVDTSEGGLIEALRRAGEGAGGQHFGWGDWEPLRYDEDDSGLEKFAKGAAAFTGDVLSDPLTYVSFGTSIGRGAASRVAAGQLSREASEELFEAAGRRALGDTAEAASREALIEEGKRRVVSELDNRTILGTVLDKNNISWEDAGRVYDPATQAPRVQRLEELLGTDDLFNVETRKLVDLLDPEDLDKVIRTREGGVSALSPRSKDLPESAMPGSVGQSLTELAVNTIGEGAYRIGGARRLRSELNRLFGDYGDEVFKRMHPDVAGGARLRVPFLRESPETGARSFGFLGDRPRASIPLFPGQTGGGQVIDSRVGRMMGLDKVADTMEGVRKWVSSRKFSVALADKLGGRWGGLAAEIMADVAREAAEGAESPGQFTRLVTHRLAAEGRERFRLNATEAYENLIRNVPAEWKTDPDVHRRINNLLSDPETLAQAGDNPDDVTAWARELREFYDRWGTQLEELGLIPPAGEGRRVNYIPHLVKDEYLDDVRRYRINRNPRQSGTNVGSGHGNLKTRQYDEFWAENQEWLEERGLDQFALEDPVLFNEAIADITDGRVSDVFVEDPFEVFNEYQRRMLSMVSEYHYMALMKRLGIVVEGDALNDILKRQGGQRFWRGLGPDPDDGTPPDQSGPGLPEVDRTDEVITPVPGADPTPRLDPPWRGGERVTPPGYPPRTAGGLPEPTTGGIPDGANVDVSRTVGPDMEPSPRLGEVVTPSTQRREPLAGMAQRDPITGQVSNTYVRRGLKDKLQSLASRVDLMTEADRRGRRLNPAEFAALDEALKTLELVQQSMGRTMDDVRSVVRGVSLEDAERATDQALAALDNAGVPMEPPAARAAQEATEDVPEVAADVADEVVDAAADVVDEVPGEVLVNGRRVTTRIPERQGDEPMVTLYRGMDREFDPDLVTEEGARFTDDLDYALVNTNRDPNTVLYAIEVPESALTVGVGPMADVADTGAPRGMLLRDEALEGIRRVDPETVGAPVEAAAETVDDVVQSVTNLNPAAGYRVDRIAKALRAGNEDLVATEQRYLADALSTQMDTAEAVAAASDAVARTRAALGDAVEEVVDEAPVRTVVDDLVGEVPEAVEPVDEGVAAILEGASRGADDPMSAPTAGGNPPDRIRPLSGAAVTDDWLPQHIAGVYQGFDDVQAFPTRARGQRAIADAVYRAVNDRPDMLDFGLSPQQRTSLEAVEAAIDGKPIPEGWQEELDTYFAERFLRANGLTFEDLQEGTDGFRELERRLGYDDLLDMDEANRIDAMAQEAFRTGNVDELSLTRPPLDDLTNQVDAAVARLADEVDNLRFGRDAAATVARQALQGEDYSAALQRLASTVDVDGNVATRWARDLAGPEDVDVDEVIDDLLDTTPKPEPAPDPEPAAATTNIPEDLRRPTGDPGRQTFADTDLVDFEVEGEGMASPSRWRTRRLSASRLFKPRKTGKRVSRADAGYDAPIPHEGGGNAPEGVYYTNRSSVVRVPTPDEVDSARATKRLKSWQKHLDKKSGTETNVDVGRLIPDPQTWGPEATPTRLRSENGRLWIDMTTVNGDTVTLDGEDFRVFEEIAETLTDADDLDDAVARMRVHVDSGPAGLAVVTFDDEVLGAMVPVRQAARPVVEGGADVTPELAVAALAQESVSLLEQVEGSIARKIKDILADVPKAEGRPIPPTGPPENLATTQRGMSPEQFLGTDPNRPQLPVEFDPTAPFRRYTTDGDNLPVPYSQARAEVFDNRALEQEAYEDLLDALLGVYEQSQRRYGRPFAFGQTVDEGVDMPPAGMSPDEQKIDDAILAFDDMPHAPADFTAPDFTAPAEVRRPSPGGRRNRLELIAKAAGLDYQDAIQGSGRKARVAPAVRDSKVWHGLLMDDFTRDALKRFGRDGKWEQFATAAFEPYMRWFRTQATVGRGPGFVVRNVIGGMANARLVGATTGDMLDGMAMARMWARADKQVTRPGLFGVALNEARHDAFEQLVRQRYSDDVADALMEAHDIFIGHGLADIRQMSLAELADFTGRSRLFDQKDADELNAVEQVLEKTALGVKPVTTHTSEWTKQAEHALRFGTFMAGARRYGLADGGYAAQQLTKASQFDYGDLSSFEQNVMRQVIPFYTFTRKNLPLNLRGLFTDPARFAHLQRGMEYLEEGMAPEEGSEGDAYSQVLPEWLEESMGFVTGIPLGGGVAGIRAESPKVHLEQWLPNPFAPMDSRQQVDTAVSQANPLFDVIFGGLTDRDPYTGQEIGTGDSSSGKFDWFARQASPLYANFRRMAPFQGTDRDESRRLGAWLSTVAGVPATTIDEDAARGALRARSRELLDQSEEQLEAMSETLGIDTTELKRLIREYGPGGAEAVLGVPSGTLATRP